MSKLICTKCEIEKSLSEFEYRKDKGVYRKQCKLCRKEYQKLRRRKYVELNKNKVKTYMKNYNKEYREKNREKLNKDSIEYYKNNKERLDEYKKQYNIKNKDEIYLKRKKYFQKYNKENRDKIYTYQKEWRRRNPEKAKQYTEKYIKNNPKYIGDMKIWTKKYNIVYRENNKDKINLIKSKYEINRRKNDPLYKLTRNCRTRVHIFLKKKGIEKNKTTSEFLGCDYKFLMEYIKSQFTKGMTISKLGEEIHLDHKIPLASAKNEEDLLKLFHYTNLQPLWAEDNLKKGAKVNFKNS